ncbi:hypothetical protein PFISCL1PPCAC_12908, partial [Pristionchus fissidentatus]
AMASVVGCVGGALSSCMGSMIFVESIAKKEPSAMNLMTFATFAFISLIGLIFTMKFFTVGFKIPFKGYWKVVVVFFLVNVINNQALNYHVPVPLHIIFRSGSLLASLVLSVLYEGKTYALRKYLSVGAITLGIIMCTLATKVGGGAEMTAEEASKHYVEWTIGIGMLSFALLASAYLAILQQNMYREYGKHPDEAMFVTHAASLPLFIFMMPDILKAAKIFSADVPFTAGPISLPIPTLWLELSLACAFNYGCIYFVYSLNASVEALTVTMVVTLRKFLSLVVSIVWFQNPFTLQHWLGTFFVFAGTLAFSDVWFEDKKKTQEKKKQ